MLTAVHNYNYNYNMTSQVVEKDVLRNDRDHPFYTGDDNPNLRMLRGVLLAHTVHDKELEYSQGMNDLVSPILVIIQDEVLGFWFVILKV